MTLCEICGVREADRVCFRCRRVVCSECWNERWMLCSECGHVKNVYEADEARMLQTIERELDLIEQRVRDRRCTLCPVLREFALLLLRALTERERRARREGFEEVGTKAMALRRRATRLCIRVLVQQGMQGLSLALSEGASGGSG